MKNRNVKTDLTPREIKIIQYLANRAAYTKRDRPQMAHYLASVTKQLVRYLVANDNHWDTTSGKTYKQVLQTN